MKYYKIFILILFIFNNLLFSQESVNKKDDFKFKKYSLQFHVSDLLDFSSFLGTLFSGKYQFSNSKAVRIGISFNGREKNSDEDITDIGYDTTRTMTSSLNKKLNVFINAQYLIYLTPQNEIKAYIGFGPYFRYRYLYSETDEEYIINNESITTEANEKNYYHIGINAALGAEYFFYKNFSLLLEYGFCFEYLIEDFNTTDVLLHEAGAIHTRKTDSRSIEFIDNNIKFGLSLYF